MNVYSTTLGAIGAFALASGVHGLWEGSSRQSKEASMVKVAIGVTILATTAFFAMQSMNLEEIDAGDKTQIADEISVVTHQKSAVSTSQYHCSPAAESALQEIKSTFYIYHSTKDLFEVVKDTKGINCHNYLPWSSKFSISKYNNGISNILSTDLKEQVMWGIDKLRRPFIAIRFTCDNLNLKVLTIVQRISKKPPLVLTHDGMDCIPIHWISGYTNFAWLRNLLTSGSTILGPNSKTAYLA